MFVGRRWQMVCALSVLILAMLALTARGDDLARDDASSVPKGLAPSDWSSIRAAYEAGRHAAHADEENPGHYRVRNPGQQWITKFDGRGFTTAPDGGGWSWGLDLVSYGRGDAQQMIKGTAKIQPSGTRVEYVWNDSLTEWYINDRRGFEHGYTLRDRPEGANGSDGMLNFTIAVRGELVPRVSENGRDVAFTAPASVAPTDGAATLTYNNLRVFDADGVHLAASFRATTTPTGTHALRLTIDDTNARYPLTIDPIVQQAYLKASGNYGTDADQFGNAVAISGNTVVVAAYSEGSGSSGVGSDPSNNAAPASGAVYVFVRAGTTWMQEAYIKPSNTGQGDQFGFSVSIAGDTLVVGAPFEDSGVTGVNGDGQSETAADAGSVYVFVRSGTTWTQQAYLKAPNTGAGDLFGYDVAISGETVVVGAYGEDSAATGVNGDGASNAALNAGAAYVFVRSGMVWTTQAYLKASNAEASDQFGWSVAVFGDTIVVGATLEDSAATGVNGNQASNAMGGSGAVYIFERTLGAWTQRAYVKASNAGETDQFGSDVALSTDTLAVGALGEFSIASGINGDQSSNGAPYAGAVYVFVRSGLSWSQQAYIKPSNPAVFDEFGEAIALSGETLVVGATGEDSSSTGVNGDGSNNNATSAGAVYVFSRTGSTWTQQAYVKAVRTDEFDLFGTSVAIEGDTVLIGAVGEDSDATGVNGNQDSNRGTASGAVYVLERGNGVWAHSAFLKASANTGVGADLFGGAVAASNDTVVVGATGEASRSSGVDGDESDNGASNAGAAYVFRRSGSVWTQEAYLKASNAGWNDRFGKSVAISGDTIVVGATQEASDARGVNGNQDNNNAFQSGAAYVFTRSGTSWSQQAYLKSSNSEAADQFGWAVAIDGDLIAVGALNEDSNATGVNGVQSNNSASNSGAVYVFSRTGAVWTQQAYLKASNTGAGDTFGNSVAVSGDTLVVGARLEGSSATGVNGDQINNNALQSGAAYVFTRGASSWSQQAYLKASNTGSTDQFGVSVGISNDTVVVGAWGEASNATGVNGDGANNGSFASGAAYVFARAGGVWSERAYLKAPVSSAGAYFGNPVAVSSGAIVVGAYSEDSDTTGINGQVGNGVASDSGAAYTFVLDAATSQWRTEDFLKASNTGSGDNFGFAVAISQDLIVVGAPYEASNASGVNGNQGNNSASSSGAAYVFVLPLPTPASPLASPGAVCGGAPAVLSVANPGPGIVIDWFAGSCGGTLIGTGDSVNVSPAVTTTYFARSRRASDGNTSDACASVTVTVAACGCGPSDVAGPNQSVGADGVLTADDIIVFLGWFFASDTRADVAGPNQSTVPDSAFTADDVIVFLGRFFQGC